MLVASYGIHCPANQKLATRNSSVIRPIYRRLIAALALVTLEALMLIVVWLLCLTVVLALGAWWLRQGTFGFDAAAFRLADAARAAAPGLTPVVVFFTWLGTQWVLVPGGLLLLAWFAFRRRHRWHSWRVPVVALGAIGLNALLKLTYHRPRPLLPHLVPAHGLSFPSGHAMVAMAFYGLLFWLLSRRLRRGWKRTLTRVGLALLILAIGGSRIYLHVHYASDVVAGFAAGLAWLLLALGTLGYLERRAARAMRAAEQGADGEG